MATILVIDDEPNMRWVLQEALTKAGHQTQTVSSGEEGLALLAEQAIDVVVLDLKLKGMDGLGTLRQIHYRWPRIVVLMLTAFGTVATAVEALQSGAADYLRKPFDVEEVLFKVSRALERQQMQQELARLKGPLPIRIPGSAPSWRRALESSIETLTRGVDLHMVGEVGSGRASLGQAAHLASPQQTAPWVTADLMTIPPTQQAGVLRGDAHGDSLWNMAGQGTILLRHIGALAQAGAEALTALLEHRNASGIGPRLVLTGMTDEWAIAPTLPHRYSCIAVPALRDHLDDLVPFAATWLPNQRIASAALAVLHAYTWPGNLCELRGVLERAAQLAGDAPIDVGHLPERVRNAPLPDTPIRLPPEGLALEEVEMALIRQALERAGGNKSRAAELLGLTRHTLLYRLEKYKIGESE